MTIRGIAAEAAGQPVGTGARAKAARAPSARRAAGLLLRRPTDLHPERQAYLERLHATDAAIASAHRLTQDFAKLVREHGAPGWRAGWAREKPARSRRCDASRRGCGPTEGFVHKLKLLKRQAYGRAGSAVLRRRVMWAA
jgi:hypothetical protein